MLHIVMNAITYMNLINDGGATQLVANKRNDIAKTN